jgi:ribose 5-phosphate isomerase B|tara:strand:+ start:416 stop:865 length:450 start_codon:yes stop_codon:yes gene_type:complete
MKIAIGSDHRGFLLKEELKNYINKLGFDVKDFGCHDEDTCDYPDTASEVANKVSQGHFDRGILICASGCGMNIVANKFPNIRAVIANDVNIATVSRAHNDTNVITIGSKYVSSDVAKNIVELWLTSDYEGERHEGRLNKLKQIENINFA